MCFIKVIVIITIIIIIDLSAGILVQILNLVTIKGRFKGPARASSGIVLLALEFIWGKVQCCAAQVASEKREQG